MYAMDQNGYPPPYSNASHLTPGLRIPMPPRSDDEGASERSRFGLGVSIQPNEPDADRRIQLLQDAGVRWWRQEFSWAEVESSPAQFDWSRWDAIISTAERHGASVLPVLMHEPRWVGIDTRDAVDAFARFAGAAAERYRGRVKYWQIWHEPNTKAWDSTPGQYARFLVAASQAIREADPNAKVLGLNTALADVQWIEKILRLIPYDSFDVLALHPNRPPNDPEERSDLWFRDSLRGDDPLAREDLSGQIEAVQRLMVVRGSLKPIWITDICWFAHTDPYGVTGLRQADLLVRAYVYAAACRVEKVFWRALADGDGGAGTGAGLCSADLVPRYAYYAYSWMTHLLEGKRLMGMPIRRRDTFAAAFTDGRSEVVVAWTTRPYAYILVDTRQQLELYDVFGGRQVVSVDQTRTRSVCVPLSPSPVYITGPAGISVRWAPEPGW